MDLLLVEGEGSLLQTIIQINVINKLKPPTDQGGMKQSNKTQCPCYSTAVTKFS